jgi:tetratricopeptide (TPR) repeat protein
LTEDASSNQIDLVTVLQDSQFDYRPEHDVYFLALQQVWDDGILTTDEQRMLDGLQESLGISKEEHDLLESKIQKDESKQHQNTYRRVLEQAWADGIITNDEQELLTNLKQKLNISDAEHAKMEMEIKSKLPSKPEDVPGEDENDPSYWIRKGEELWSNSNGNESDAQASIEFFDKAIKLQPLNYFAWVNKGLILKKMDQRDEALLCYDRAIQINSDYPNAWFNKGVLLGCIGKLEDAVQCFEKVLSIDPDHQLAQRDKQMLSEIINRKHISRIKTRTLKLKTPPNVD